MSEIDSQEPEPVTIANMTWYVEEGWRELQTFVSPLTAQQLTQPTDAAGWTVKDHLIHLALWQNGITALLNKQSRAVAMKIEQDFWESTHDSDEINAVMQRMHHDMPLEAVRQALEHSYQDLLKTLSTLSDEDLMLPYAHYDPSSGRDAEVFGYIVGNSFMHYREHIPWMAAIVAQE